MTYADSKYQSNKNVSKEQQTKPNKQTKVKQVESWFGQPEEVYLTKHDLINNERTVLFASTSKWIYLQIKLGKIKETVIVLLWTQRMKCLVLLKSWYDLCHLLPEIPEQTRTQQKADPSKMTWECPPAQLEEEWGRCRPPCSFLWSIHSINISALNHICY